MSKDKLTDYDATASGNLDIGGISIAEGMLPSAVNNSLREQMSHLKEALGSGTPLYVDQTNNLLGVGTASPIGSLSTQCTAGDSNFALTAYHPTSTSARIIAKFQSNVGGTQQDKVVIQCNGNVGIGTASPSQLLSIVDTNARMEVISSVGGTSVIDMGTTSDADAAGVRYASGTGAMSFRANGDERMRIDSSGKVGIGTSSPSAHLQVETSANSPVLIKSTYATGGYVQHDTGANGANIGYVGCSNALVNTGGTESLTDFAIRSQGNMVFSTGGGTERFRCDSAGHFMIGTTSRHSESMLSISPQDTNRMVTTRSYNTSAQHHFLFENNSGTGVGTITCSTSATTFSTSSDYRLKTAVTYDWDATSRLKQLKPARFKWIAEGDDAVEVDGFLAHEVESIVPESISGNGKDAMKDEEYVVSQATGDIYTPAAEATFDNDGNEISEATDEVIHKTNAEKPDTLENGQKWRETTAAKMGTRSVPDLQGIDQSKLVPLLCKTILELEARITALEAG